MNEKEKHEPDFVQPIELIFRAKIIEDKFYTLDGVKIIPASHYCKYIRNIDELCHEELIEMARRVVEFQKQINEVLKVVDKLRN